MTLTVRAATSADIEQSGGCARCGKSIAHDERATAAQRSNGAVWVWHPLCAMEEGLDLMAAAREVEAMINAKGRYTE